MSISSDNPGSENLRWTVNTISGRAFNFNGGAGFVVGDVIPDGEEIQTIEFGMDLDPSWRFSVVLSIGPRGVEPVDVRFSELGEASTGDRWALFKTLGMGAAGRTIDSGLEVLTPLLPTAEALRLSCRRPGRRARLDSFYAAKAKAWCDALGEHPERPTRHLVEVHPSTTVKRWQGWLKIAEQRGLFERPPGAEGRAAGQMTTKGQMALHGGLQ